MEEITQQYGALLALIDSWFSRAMQLHPGEIACKSGCSFCCRSLFDITFLDAFYLKKGFDLLPEHTRAPVLAKCRERVATMREEWPEFSHPYLLNYRPEEDWEHLMPEEDETPCVLVGEDGRCLVYEHRPMTCRLHGIPMVDVSGELMHDDWCTMNFEGVDPQELEDMRAPFDAMFRQEVALLRAFTDKLLNKPLSELDTFIPTALLIDFEAEDRERWIDQLPQ